jgi:hypothetical protein
VVSTTIDRRDKSDHAGAPDVAVHHVDAAAPPRPHRTYPFGQTEKKASVLLRCSNMELPYDTAKNFQTCSKQIDFGGP